jgi:aminoglycoside phosphotransferase family enzyme
MPDAAVAETHSATVVFIGDRAYKIKKPLDLGFSDFRTVEARRQICHREVELNRRLAPDVYLGVADVSGPDGDACHHMVVMRRMPTDRRLSALVSAGVPVRDELRETARLLATLHARSPRSPAADVQAGIDATRHRWNENTNALIREAGGFFDERTVALVHGLACRYLDGRQPLFDARIAHHRAVDGHGDLLADDIFLLDDGPRILDCIEFDDDLRLGDGLADVAFLAMDLERLGHPELAAAFVADYGELLGDTWPRSLLHHHIAYRAQVRAKVTALRAHQGHPEMAGEATALLDLAERHLELARVRLVLIGGLPGTGKSTLAAALAQRTDASVLRSDEVRKELAGCVGQAAAAPFGAGIYDSDFTAATYRELLHRAGVALLLGESVIVDASWADEAWRAEARLMAAVSHSDVVELRCEASVEVANKRMLVRAATGTDPSDADSTIAAAMADRVAPWPQAVTVDTSAGIDAALKVSLPLIQPRHWIPEAQLV